MKHLLLLITFFAYSFSINAMHPSPSETATLSKKRKLSAEQALINHHKELSLLSSFNALPVTYTPILDAYKCAFILGCLKPNGQKKLYRKIPHEIGALLAQRKHMGKTLSPIEESEVLEWQVQLAQKYSPQK